VEQTVLTRLARGLTDLADRIPFSGVLNSDPQMWTKFNDLLAKATDVSNIRMQCIWLTRQVKPDMVLESWRTQRHDAWIAECELCDTAQHMQALIREFSSDGT